MIIKWLSEFHGPIGFFVEPEDYDGTPRVPHLWIDAAPKNRHFDRQAVAAFLLFGRNFGGPVRMPHKFSPAVANAIRAMAAPVSLDLEPIEYYPKALPSGERNLRLVVDEAVPSDFVRPIGQEDAFLELLPSDRASGAIRRINGLSVASNAWIHSRGGSLESWYPFIAMACLFAEDLDAGTIILPSTVAPEAEEWNLLVSLLGTARLGIEVEATRS